MKSELRIKNYKNQVYALVRGIPPGKVATYGQIAAELQNSEFKLQISPWLVGFVLHQNKDQNVPCHRVVDRNGRIAPNFGLGGSDEQRARLIAEGVAFKDSLHVDVGRCFLSRF